jgi:hypothetical protein
MHMLWFNYHTYLDSRKEKGNGSILVSLFILVGYNIIGLDQ